MTTTYTLPTRPAPVSPVEPRSTSKSFNTTSRLRGSLRGLCIEQIRQMHSISNKRSEDLLSAMYGKLSQMDILTAQFNQTVADATRLYAMLNK